MTDSPAEGVAVNNIGSARVRGFICHSFPDETAFPVVSRLSGSSVGMEILSGSTDRVGLAPSEMGAV